MNLLTNILLSIIMFSIGILAGTGICMKKYEKNNSDIIHFKQLRHISIIDSDLKQIKDKFDVSFDLKDSSINIISHQLFDGLKLSDNVVVLDTN